MSNVVETRNWEWTIWDAVRRLAAQNLGIGDTQILARYKDAWVREHREEIIEAADTYELPDILLAGVCWVEVGGDPDILDSFAYAVRSFDHLADPFLEPLTITKRPEMTSMGDVSIQLRRAAETSDDSWGRLNASEQARILACLQSEPCNIGVVARHLRQLKRIDFGDRVAPVSRVIEITGTRYNRGPDLPLSSIELDTRYGDFILRQSGRLRALLSE